MSINKVGSPASRPLETRSTEDLGQQFDRLAEHFQNALQNGTKPLLPSLQQADTQVLQSLYLRLRQGEQAGSASWAPKTPEMKKAAAASGEAAALVGKELRARGVYLKSVEPTITPIG